jgi:hypothetical protein
MAGTSPDDTSTDHKGQETKVILANKGQFQGYIPESTTQNRSSKINHTKQAGGTQQMIQVQPYQHQ